MHETWGSLPQLSFLQEGSLCGRGLRCGPWDLLPSAGLGRELRLARRPGPSRRDSAAVHYFGGNCVLGALRCLNATIGFSGPASVPTANVPSATVQPAQLVWDGAQEANCPSPSPPALSATPQQEGACCLWNSMPSFLPLFVAPPEACCCWGGSLVGVACLCQGLGRRHAAVFLPGQSLY